MLGHRLTLSPTLTLTLTPTLTLHLTRTLTTVLKEEAAAGRAAVREAEAEEKAAAQAARAAQKAAEAEEKAAAQVRCRPAHRLAASTT